MIDAAPPQAGAAAPDVGGSRAAVSGGAEPSEARALAREIPRNAARPAEAAAAQRARPPPISSAGGAAEEPERARESEAPRKQRAPPLEDLSAREATTPLLRALRAFGIPRILAEVCPRDYETLLLPEAGRGVAAPRADTDMRRLFEFASGGREHSAHADPASWVFEDAAALLNVRGHRYSLAKTMNVTSLHTLLAHRGNAAARLITLRSLCAVALRFRTMRRHPSEDRRPKLRVICVRPSASAPAAFAVIVPTLELHPTTRCGREPASAADVVSRRVVTGREPKLLPEAVACVLTDDAPPGATPTEEGVREALRRAYRPYLDAARAPAPGAAQKRPRPAASPGGGEEEEEDDDEDAASDTESPTRKRPASPRSATHAITLPAASRDAALLHALGRRAPPAGSPERAPAAPAVPERAPAAPAGLERAAHDVMPFSALLLLSREGAAAALRRNPRTLVADCAMDRHGDLYANPGCLVTLGLIAHARDAAVRRHAHE